MKDFQSFLDESLSKIEILPEKGTEAVLPGYDIYKEIQEQIRRLRKDAGLTQKQLSQATGISQANISNMEKGLCQPTIESLKKIADAFGKRLVVEFEDREEEI
mgnify:CR=1 FL=1